MYKVVWKDHCSFDEVGWRLISEIGNSELIDLVTITSYGEVLYEDDNIIIIAGHVSQENDKYLGEMAILKSSIIDMIKLND